MSVYAVQMQSADARAQLLTASAVSDRVRFVHLVSLALLGLVSRQSLPAPR
jgi:hypothetical protein